MANLFDVYKFTFYWLGMPLPDENIKPSHPRAWPVTSIVERTQCLTSYIAVLAQTQPQRISDLLSYQHLMLEVHLEYEGDGWVAYDHCFCQT